jgi:hypothetical protein
MSSPTPIHHDDPDWGTYTPASIPYDQYMCSTISYCTRDQCGSSALETHSYTSRPRWEVASALLTHQHLRGLLETNIALLDMYGEAGLASGDVCAMNLFAQNHCGVSETLTKLRDYVFSYGLPNDSGFYRARCFFSHGFLTPGRTAFEVQGYVRGTRELYGELLEQVEATERLLGEGLSDEDRWVEEKSCVVQDEEGEEGEWQDRGDGGGKPEVEEGEVDEGIEEDILTPDSITISSSSSEAEPIQFPTPSRQSLLLKSFKTAYFRSAFVRRTADAVGKAILDVYRELHGLDQEDYLVEESQDERIDEGYESGKEVDDWELYG